MAIYQDKAEMQKLYDQYGSGNAIAKAIGIDPKTAYTWIAKHGITTKGTQGARKHHYNYRYFDHIDTEEKAYWLGFLLADGCVYQGSGGNSHRLQINLQGADYHHLEKFQEAIGSSYKIQRKTVKGSDVAILKVNSTQMCEDLMKHGVVPRKTLVGVFPDVEELLYHHLIRGFFDGDGSFTTSRSGSVHIKFAGGRDMLTQVQTFFAKHSVPAHFYDISYSKAVSLETGGRHQVKRALDAMYHDATVYLDRKFDKYQSYICPLQE